MEYSLHTCTAPYAIRAAWSGCARCRSPYQTMTTADQRPPPITIHFFPVGGPIARPHHVQHQEPSDGWHRAGGVPIHGGRQNGQVAGELLAAGCNQCWDIETRTSSFPPAPLLLSQSRLRQTGRHFPSSHSNSCPLSSLAPVSFACAFVSLRHPLV